MTRGMTTAGIPIRGMPGASGIPRSGIRIPIGILVMIISIISEGITALGTAEAEGSATGETANDS